MKISGLFLMALGFPIGLLFFWAGERYKTCFGIAFALFLIGVVAFSFGCCPKPERREPVLMVSVFGAQEDKVLLGGAKKKKPAPLYKKKPCPADGWHYLVNGKCIDQREK